MTTVVILTAGRLDYLERTVESFRQNVTGMIDQVLVVNDSPSDHDAVTRICNRFKVVQPALVSVGQAEAIRFTFEILRDSRSEYVFWLEEDFTFDRPIALHDLARLLECNPHIYQAQLLRQAWFKSEIAAGGIIERDFGEYEHLPGRVEHCLWWTWNPSMFRRADIVGREYPTGKKHEWDFGRQLLREDRGRRFAFLGDGAPQVTHIGERRA